MTPLASLRVALETITRYHERNMRYTSYAGTAEAAATERVIEQLRAAIRDIQESQKDTAAQLVSRLRVVG